MTEKLHIIPHNHKITAEDREQKNGHKSAVLWFTGLSGSGKSSLAGALENYLFENGRQVYILDGDNVRMGLNADLDFSDAGRVENIRRIAEVANLFRLSGTLLLTAFISPFKADRELARKTVGDSHFFEIYVRCPIEVCESRDVKGLYKKARNGEIKNFTGISSPFEEPVNADLIVDTNLHSLEECLGQLISFVNSKIQMNG
ncbi:MAG: adenylyl-sulfate kinase [Bacteroidetes bacterium]|nr:adenylyl-sulfate kinase [Bacteroidota bacterium]